MTKSDSFTSEIIITKHALDRFETRYKMLHKGENRPLMGYEHLLKKIFSIAKLIDKPLKMRNITYFRKELINHDRAKYYTVMGWTFVVIEEGKNKRIITVY